MKSIEADYKSAARPFPRRRFAARNRLRERPDVVDRSGSVAGKRRDLLPHTIFQNPEIRRVQAADVMAFLIGHDDWNQHLLNVHPDGGLLLCEQAPSRAKEDYA